MLDRVVLFFKAHAHSLKVLLDPAMLLNVQVEGIGPGVPTISLGCCASYVTF